MAKLLLGSVVGPQGPQGTPGVNGSQGPQGIPGPNEIAATTEVVGLTSGQLLYNNGGKVGSVDIVDNLLSIDPDKPLSANQGKVLKSLIDDNSSAIGQSASHFHCGLNKSISAANGVNTIVAFNNVVSSLFCCPIALYCLYLLPSCCSNNKFVAQRHKLKGTGEMMHQSAPPSNIRH